MKKNTYGLLRGGYIDSGANAGPFLLYVNFAPTSTGSSIGFRPSLFYSKYFVIVILFLSASKNLS